MIGEDVRDPARGVGLRRTRTVRVSSPFSSTQALNGDIEGPVCRMNMWMWSVDELLRAEDDAAEAAALAVDMLGGRIDHAIGAERERALPKRRREHVVDHQRRARLMRDLGDAGDVDHFQRRIGRRLEEAGLGVRAQRRPPGVEIGAVDDGRGHAEARQVVLDHVEARAEQRPRRHDMVAGLDLAHQGRASPRPCRSRSRARPPRPRTPPSAARTSSPSDWRSANTGSRDPRP